MDTQITSIDTITDRARAAARHRQTTDECPYPDGTDAREIWLAEYRRQVPARTTNEEPRP